MTPVIVDSFGNQRLATQPIIINVNSPSANADSGAPPVVNLVSPYKNDMGQTSVLSENNPSEISDIKVGSSIPIVAFSEDEDKDFQSLRFYCNGSPISDDIPLDITKLFSDEHPYSMVWEANETGIFHFYAVGQDQAGNVSFSNVSTVQVLPQTGQIPSTPSFTGSYQLAQAQANILLNGSLDSINLVSPGYGFVTAPEVRIDNFGTGGSGASAVATIDAISKTVTGITVTSPGTGYTSAPKIFIEKGFASNESTGSPAAGTIGFAGVNGINITQPGFGYSAEPTVTVANAAGSGIVLQAIMDQVQFLVCRLIM